MPSIWDDPQQQARDAARSNPSDLDSALRNYRSDADRQAAQQRKRTADAEQSRRTAASMIREFAAECRRRGISPRPVLYLTTQERGTFKRKAWPVEHPLDEAGWVVARHSGWNLVITEPGNVYDANRDNHPPANDYFRPVEDYYRRMSVGLMREDLSKPIVLGCHPPFGSGSKISGAPWPRQTLRACPQLAEILAHFLATGIEVETMKFIDGDGDGA
ncbi:hypothetical protein [Nocardia aurantia]|uniref:Uncharacterized protein n=1 Tax=Nocardia aurantia TaxID=2585199 RepID=A0A7K0DND5_9NOCA|nr:hypothetical protein [Nocardia aurantia]MQY27229.1 hypothetical protein [Nocardia aurantia]